MESSQRVVVGLFARKGLFVVLLVVAALVYLSSDVLWIHEEGNIASSVSNIDHNEEFYKKERKCHCTPRCKTTPWDETLTTKTFQITFERKGAEHNDCHFHYRSINEIYNYLTGKWMFLGGDSHIRGLTISLLSMFDKSMSDPFEPVRWLNSSTVSEMKFRFLDVVIQRTAPNTYAILLKKMEVNDYCSIDNPLPFNLKKLDAVRLTFCMFTFTSDMYARLPYFSDLLVRPNIYYFNVVSWDMVFETEYENFAMGFPQTKLPRKIISETNCVESLCIWISKPAFLLGNGAIDYVVLSKLLPTGQWYFLNRTTSSAHMRGNNTLWTNGHTTMLYNHLDHQRLFSFLMENDPKFANDPLECDETLEWGFWCNRDTPLDPEVQRRAVENWHHRCEIKLHRTDGNCKKHQLNHIF